MYFSKDNFGLVKCANFEPMLSNFGPSQGRKGLKKGANLAPKWVKTMVFHETILVQLWCPNGWIQLILSPFELLSSAF